MSRATKDDWLKGPGDLEVSEVKDVPVKGKSVKVRGLAAAFSNRAQGSAMEMRQEGRDQVARVNTEKMEAIQFAMGVIEPEFTEAEAQQIQEKYGPAFRRVVDEIDRLSSVDKQAIAEAEARFQGGGEDAKRGLVDDAATAGSR